MCVILAVLSLMHNKFKFSPLTPPLYFSLVLLQIAKMKSTEIKIQKQFAGKN